MKLLIIGMLGAGKSTLAYRLAQKHKLPVLRIDEISRDKETGSYYHLEQQYQKQDDFVLNNENWIAEDIKNIYMSGSNRHWSFI